MITERIRARVLSNVEAGSDEENYPRPAGFISTWVVLEQAYADFEGSAPLAGRPPPHYWYEVVGKGCLAEAFGQIFGHSFEVWPPPPDGAPAELEPNAAAILWDCARSLIWAKGYEKVITHFEPDTSDRIREFWIRLGAVKKFEGWELDLVNGRGGRVRRLKYRNLHP